jgi:hypothetical protein
MIRSSITLLTHLGPSSSGATRVGTVAASVVSVNGSARTAKLATMARVRTSYRRRLKGMQQGKELQRECGKLEELLGTIQSID